MSGPPERDTQVGDGKPLELRRQLAPGVLLRPLDLADADALHTLVAANRDHLRPWMPWADQDADATAAFVALTAAEAQRRAALHLAIVVDGALAGTCGLHGVAWRHGGAELGYWIAAGIQGRGIVARAVAALLDHAFDDLGLHRIELRAAPGNDRSRAVAERLGFTREGVLREAERFPDRFGDTVVHAMLAHEWRGRADALRQSPG